LFLATIQVDYLQFIKQQFFQHVYSRKASKQSISPRTELPSESAKICVILEFPDRTGSFLALKEAKASPNLCKQKMGAALGTRKRMHHQR